jgi:hypothetical protein
VGGCFSDEDLDDVGREELLEAVEFALRSPLLVGTDERRESDRGCTRRRTRPHHRSFLGSTPSARPGS